MELRVSCVLRTHSAGRVGPTLLEESDAPPPKSDRLVTYKVDFTWMQTVGEKQDRQCSYNVTLWGFLVIIVAMGMRQ